MLQVTFALTLAGYLASSVVFYSALVRAQVAPSLLGVARRLLIGTALLHAMDIALRAVVMHTCPVLSAAFALSLTALAATIGFLLWARQGRMVSLGVIVAPIALGLIVASEVLMRQATANDVPAWLLALHVLANLGAVALFVIAAAGAIIYLLQAGRLKSKRPTIAGFAFPGLSTLEVLIERSLGWGLGLMTLGVVSGAVFAERLAHGGVESARMILAYTCWLGAAGLVVGQKLVGWNGRKVAWGAVVVAVVAVAVVLLYALAAEGRA
jgi:ABC-type uncharacterized transport system permease subunit